MNTHKDLNVWKLSLELVTEVYQFSKKLPKDEQFGIVAQMRRASVSVPANIAEGAARQSTREFIRFLYISKGSLSELETLLYVTRNLYQEDITKLEAGITSLIKMLVRLIVSLRNKLNRVENC